MQALKALVIFMGVLIVIGMVVLAYGIAVKFGNVTGGDEAGPTVPLAGVPAVTEVWNRDLKVVVPGGAQVAETIVADGQIVVRLALPDDSQRYLIFDLGTGKQIGAIDLVPQGGAK